MSALFLDLRNSLYYLHFAIGKVHSACMSHIELTSLLSAPVELSEDESTGDAIPYDSGEKADKNEKNESGSEESDEEEGDDM